jgi:peptidyl-prolyl cis-trans isomerase D
MLRFLRKYSRSVGVKILYGVLAALFVVWGVGAVGGERVDVVAQVHDETITRRDLDRAESALQERYQNMFQGRFSPDMLRSINVRSQALDQLVEQALVRHEATRLGIAVSDAELIDTITRMPELQDGGRFDRDRLESYLRFQRDRGEFEQEVRQSILSDRVRALVTDAVAVSDAEVAERYRLDREQMDLAFVRFSGSDHAAGVTLSEAELEQYLTEHGDRYRVPTRVRVRYAVYRPADYRSEVAPSEGEIAEYYELNKDERFAEPEQIRARHILVKVAPKANEEAKAPARKKADDLLAQLKAGGDFEALAKKNSDDPGSASKGGDLGFFPRGRMTPAFESAAFALEPGSLSEVVETPFGFHIIRLEERREAGNKPPDAVRGEIVETLAQEKAMSLARKQAEEDRREIVRGQSFAEAVSGRQVEETAPFAEGADVPGVGRVQPFTEAAFALDQGGVSDLIETEDAVYLMTLTERIETSIPPLAEVREAVEKDARQARGEAAAKAAAEQLLARAREVGLERAAADAGKTIEETGPFDRRGSVPKLAAAMDLRNDALGLTTETPLAPKVYAAGGDTAVVALRRRIPADMAGLAEAKDSLRESMLTQKRTATLSAYIDFLKERAQKEGALDVRADALGRG